MRITISIILILISQICNGQITSIKKWHITKSSRDSIFGYVHIDIDTINGDTAKYSFRGNRYVELNKEGIMVVDGHKLGGMGTDCGCETIPHGYWIERYQNGSFKEHGRYFCSRKIGTWIFYHENGQIEKIENYKRAYIKMFTMHPWDTLKAIFLLEGPYLEYYPKGQLKTEGKFEILEEFSTVDTIYTFDSETYEPIEKVIKGEFWIPRSKKSGYWNSYSEAGEVISHQYFDLKDDNLRNIESRYWDIIQQIINYNEKKKE